MEMVERFFFQTDDILVTGINYGDKTGWRWSATHVVLKNDGELHPHTIPCPNFGQYEFDERKVREWARQKQAMSIRG